MEHYFNCSSDGPIVKTHAGLLRGFQLDTTYTFQGIRYAKADRFKMPEEVEPWDGVKDATSYGYVCPLLNQDVPNGEVLIAHRYWPMDENCQYLNIWTQSLDVNAKKPVLVWLHGGGFYAGSSIEQVCYDGTNLSAFGDVVVVSLNHRLNVFGYFNLSQYGEEYANSGNLGNADIVEALRWIQNNIAGFGGDPDNVTLFGQSGGGMKVWTLMQTPAADHLYHKGVVLSGALEDFIEEKNTDGRPLVRAMLKHLGLTESEVKKLETVPARDLIDAYNAVSQEVLGSGGCIGGHPIRNGFYLGDPVEVGFTDYAKSVPLLVGSVFSEIGFGPGVKHKYELSEEETRAIVEKRFSAATDEIISLFKKAYPGKAATDLLYYDVFFRKPSRALINAKAKCTEAPTYAYLFAYDFPIDDGKSAWHCSDLPFIFHNADIVPVANIPGVSDALQDKMAGALIAFAKTGNPAWDKDVNWPACTENKEWTMVFENTSAEAKCNFDAALQDAVCAATPFNPFSVTQRRKWVKNPPKKEMFLH